MNMDHAKVRRESLRWLIVLALNHARPEELHEQVVLVTAQAIYPDATPMEVRRELDYLVDRDLVKVRKSPGGPWFGELTRFGTDLAEYTIDCEPGIARPAKYW